MKKILNNLNVLNPNKITLRKNINSHLHAVVPPESLVLPVLFSRGRWPQPGLLASWSPALLSSCLPALHSEADKTFLTAHMRVKRGYM